MNRRNLIVEATNRPFLQEAAGQTCSHSYFWSLESKTDGKEKTMARNGVERHRVKGRKLREPAPESETSLRPLPTLPSSSVLGTSRTKVNSYSSHSRISLRGFNFTSA